MKACVLYISNSAALGGAEQSLIDMLKAVKENIQPIVVLPTKGIIEERLKELNIRYYIVAFTNGYGRIGANGMADWDNNFSDNYAAALKVCEIIEKEKVSLVHINSSVSNVGAFAALLSNIPFVWHFREFLEEDFDSEFWDKALKKKLISYADRVITISDAVQKSYKEKYNIESVRVYNGIDATRYKTDLSHCNNWSGDYNFIITGAITENKGQWDAIKAINVLKEKGYRNIHLTLIGKCGDRFSWIINKYIQENQLQNYISISPFQKYLNEYRKNSQFAITTSKMEALGRCTIEAMLAGNVMIGANTGGTRELIGEREERGYTYCQGDYNDLAKVMEIAIFDKEGKNIEYRKNAQNYAECTFSLEKYRDIIIEIYDKVLQEYKEKEKECIFDKEKFLEYLVCRYSKIKEKNIQTKCKFPGLNKIDQLSKLRDQKGKLSQFFKKNAYNTVAIYGMGNLGYRLYDMISSCGLEISYVVDKNSMYIEDIVKVIKPDDVLPQVDVLIVAVEKEEENLIKQYKEKSSFEIIGISDFLKALN